MTWPVAAVDDPTREAPLRTHVLIVDDEPDLLRLTSLLLTMKGYQVTTTSDPTEALRILTGGEDGSPTVDLLVTDLAMPGMTGTELIARLRSEGVELPTLVISGYGTLDVCRYMRVGIDDYIDKPFQASEFVERVAALRSGRQHQGRVARRPSHADSRLL